MEEYKEDNDLLNKIVVEDDYSGGGYFQDNFCIFKSINNDILYIVYTGINNSIISYDLININKVFQIKNVQNNEIIKYYLDINNKRDLILSLGDNGFQLWNFYNMECIVDINNIYNAGHINSGCLFFDNTKINIVTSCSLYGPGEPLKVFDINGNLIKEIKNSAIRTNYIDTYKDDLNIYIIAANSKRLKAYNFYKNEEYHTFWDYEYNYKYLLEGINHIGFVIINEDNIIKIF